MDTFDLKCCKGTVEVLTPSKIISPSMTGTIFNRDIIKDDFPLPVRPQIPTYWYRYKLTNLSIKISITYLHYFLARIDDQV